MVSSPPKLLGDFLALKIFFEDIFHNTGQYNNHRNKVNPYKSNVPNDTETGQLVCDIIEWVLYDWKHWLEVGW